jgi:hypothetical protein
MGPGLWPSPRPTGQRGWDRPVRRAIVPGVGAADRDATVNRPVPPPGALTALRITPKPPEAASQKQSRQGFAPKVGGPEKILSRWPETFCPVLRS